MIKFSLVAFTACVIIASGTQANAVSLRTSIIVEGKYLTLGDLFGISGEQATTPIAHAPKPGQKSTFNANWLYRVARTHKVNWRPISLNTHVVVERSSQVIYRDEVEDALIASLREQDVNGDIELTINGGSRKFHVASDQPATIGVENMVYDPGTGRFIGIVVAPANDPSAQRLRITGRVHQLKAIPIISKRLRRGEVITKNDIGWLNVRSSTIGKDMILDEEDLIGMAAKRTIRESTPIRFSHVRQPILVVKGGLVTINLTTPTMRLTAQGKALQEGSLGDIVKIKNTQSNQTIEAKVNGLNEVKVLLLQRAALN